ncbi:MAG: filamentous hemagglutinin N-terminal domain-containing protein [Gammaproteobacteria bacterium]|nr:filamentous hemagglutinin N-terminal domain-containing protein [Gammaproteobacteria bacterium]
MTATSQEFFLKPIAAGIRSRTSIALGYGALAALPGLALAGPAGEQLLGGAATVARPDAGSTVVTQTSQQAVMNWQSFSIAGNEYVKFVQPGTNAAILNRVVGPDMSSIFGRLEANGRVFLVNPRGVYFAPGAQVDVGAIAASVLDIRDDDFMNGRYVFTKTANSPDGASVVNEGRISTNGADGFVALLGDRADNSGLISAKLGTVALASGNKITLDINQDGLVNIAVDEKTVSALAGVKNAGQIVADGGRVVMTAKVADGLAAAAVNNEGLMRARSIQEHEGEIVLAAGGGNVVNAGTIDVAGEQGQSGGKAVVVSDHDVTLAPQSTIDASGDAAGNGGAVRVIADGHLNFAAGATIVATGGDQGGTGGAVEVSGHQSIALRGKVELGKGGQLFIDPARLKILNDASNPSYGNGSGSLASSFTTVGKSFIENQLKSGVNVSLIATNEIFAAGPMTVDATSGSLAGNLRLGIGNYSGACSFGVCSGVPTFLPTAAGDIHLAGVNIALRGQLNAQAGSTAGVVQLGNVSANRVQVTAHGDVTMGSLTLTGSGALKADIAATGAHLTVAGPISAIAIPNTGVYSLVSLSGNSVDVAQGATLSGFSGGSNSGAYFGGAMLNIQAATHIGVTGAVSVTGSYGAGLRFNASSGPVVTSGAITVRTVQASGDARLRMDGTSLNLNGAITVATAASYGSASIDLNAQNGLVVNGNITATGGSASISAHNFSTGNVQITGNVLATATRGDASIDIGNSANGGGIAINGNLTANGGASSSASGSVYVHNSGGGAINVNGSVTVTGGDSGAWIDIENWNGGGINVSGNMTATAASSSSSIYVKNQGAGNIAIGGNLSVANTGGSGWISLYNDSSGGNITVGGAMSAVGKWQQIIRVSATGSIAVNGAITASAASSNALVQLRGATVAVKSGISVRGTGSGYLGSTSYGGSSYSGAAVDILGQSGVSVAGTIVATGPSFAGVRIRNTSAGAITIGGPVAAVGGSSGYVQVRNGGAGGIQTIGAGILIANTEVFIGDDGGGPVSVQTNAPMINFAVPGTFAPAVAIDNRTYAGQTVLYLSSQFALPSSIGLGSSARGSSSGTAMLGETKFGFGGNTLIVGDFAAKNLYVEVNNGGLFIPGSVLIGDVPLPAKLGDELTIKALSLAVRPDGQHLPVPEYQGKVGVGPNAVFRAQGGIMIGASGFGHSGASGGLKFDDPDTPYVVFQSDGPVLTGPVQSINPTKVSFIAQYAAYTHTNPIAVEGTYVSGMAGTGFYADTNFKTLPGTTILIGGLSLPGGKQTGKITIGSGGAFDIGDQNILFATTGGVSGIKNVLSTGFIADLELLLAPVTEVFKAPVVDEFSDDTTTEDDERRNNVDTGEEGEGGGGDGLITQQSNKGQLCQ